MLAAVGTGIVCRFPMPPAGLSPNGRVHFMQKARLTKQYRLDCAWIAKAGARMQTLSELRSFPWERATATVVFEVAQPGRRRDADNALASLKALWDGIVDAGLLTDDRGLRVVPADPLFVKGESAVWVKLEEA